MDWVLIGSEQTNIPTLRSLVWVKAHPEELSLAQRLKAFWQDRRKLRSCSTA